MAVLFFSSMGLMVSCGKDDKPSLEDRLGNQEEALESFEGVIEGVSKDVYQEGTHQLLSEEKEVIYLQSPTIDLNKYIGKPVIVQGKVKKGVGTAKPVVTVSKIEYVKEDAVQAGFKLYENKAFGLKFEHPSTWLPTESANGVTFSFQEEVVAKITVFANESNLKTFVDSKEEGEGSQVTVDAQSAERFLSGSNITFYIPNPPKKKIYQFKFTPTAPLIERGENEGLKDEFYALIQSIQLIYLSQAQGKVCGGEPVVECPEDYFCELDNGSEFAEGVCVEIGGVTDTGNCPFISPPSTCSEYRISDYAPNGCPSGYECSNGDEGHTGTDFIPEEEGQSEVGDYEVPALSAVSGVYVNDKLGFSMNYPKSWYYTSFGPIEGAQGKIGFADGEFEGLEQALITLSVQKTEGGKASTKIGDLYYVFDGPSDLTGVMEEMAQSVEKIDE